jgi:pimeloyl-ACP methyl ester carboxylesterase
VITSDVVSFVTLKNGRQISYAEYGVPTGFPILYFHGFPSSRLDWLLFNDEPLLSLLNVRIIAPDRPGYGYSGFQRGRKLIDWPEDVLELADQLRIGRFSILGISGGGPYALACAALLDDRLQKTGIVCSMGPHDAPGARDGTSWTLPDMNPIKRRLMLKLTAFGMNRDPDQFLERSRATFSEPDRNLLDEPELASVFIDGVREAFLGGIKGANLEAGLYTRPWGFELSAIDAEVHLWHGAQDYNVPISIGRCVAEALPDCQANFLEEEGHLTLPRHHLADILATLMG